MNFFETETFLDLLSANEAATLLSQFGKIHTICLLIGLMTLGILLAVMTTLYINISGKTTDSPQKRKREQECYYSLYFKIL